MTTSVRDKLNASAESMLGSTSTDRPEGWARRVLANLSAHVANGVPLTEESRQALAQHNEAMSRIAIGDLVAVDNSGHVVPAGPFRAAVARVVALGENGQVQLMPLNAQSRQLLETTLGPPQRTPQEFVREHMNVPPPPNPNTPGGQARIRREQAMARNPPPTTSELPPTRNPINRHRELAEEEERQEQQRVRELLALQALMLAGNRPPAEDSPPPPPPDPLQHAIPVLEGRPKRRILRKRKTDGEV